MGIYLKRAPTTHSRAVPVLCISVSFDVVHSSVGGVRASEFFRTRLFGEDPEWVA